MTDDIPDDVVERALAEWFRMPASEARYLPYAHTMRAALRVAVEWEREQCARVAEDFDDRVCGDEILPPSQFDIAAAIRSRKDRHTPPPK